MQSKSILMQQKEFILLNFIYNKNPEIFIKNHLQKINILLNETEMKFLVDEMKKITATVVNIEDLSETVLLVSQTETILAKLNNMKNNLEIAPGPQTEDYQSFIAKSQSNENYLSHK